jgi:hypothetical protein
VSLLSPDPFGEKPAPWWERMWRRGRSKGAPKGYAMVAGAVGLFAGFLLSGLHGIDHSTRTLLVPIMTGLPPALLEIWWKQRARRRAEQLLPE